MDWTRLDELEKHIEVLTAKYQDIRQRQKELEIRLARAELAASSDSQDISERDNRRCPC